MSTLPYVVDVDEPTFESEVVARSHETAVVVDFWAAWCGPCRALGPVLEKLAAEAEGEWVLAKVDVDRNQRLAATFGIQGIPAVKAFKDGRVVAEFTGALPEPQVRTWLGRLGPGPADAAFEEATTLERAGELERAAEALRRALASEPGHGAARRALARVELALRTDSTDVLDLERRLDADPADLDAATRLADARALRGDLESAAAALLGVVSVTSGEARDRARRHLLTILDTMTADDPRALAARRALSLVLY